MRTYAEKIFDEPNFLDASDEAETEGEAETVGLYVTATVTHTGDQWTAVARDLPGGHVVRAEGATWREARKNIARCVLDLLQDEPGITCFQVVPADPEAKAALEGVMVARSARAEAELAEVGATRSAARLLLDKGWGIHDVGTVLMLPRRRISQLLHLDTE
ncbi:hypothetical protein [Streptosporangium sandarakinum]|uniref:hypothetical protein n=1 Tax=Streptosporangium sandarakinum TaxID=1260955 RepID=UPI0033B5CC8E